MNHFKMTPHFGIQLGCIKDDPAFWYQLGCIIDYNYTFQL